MDSLLACLHEKDSLIVDVEGSGVDFLAFGSLEVPSPASSSLSKVYFASSSGIMGSGENGRNLSREINRVS